MVVVDNWKELINILLKDNKKGAYIVGAGNFGKIFGDYFNKSNIVWKGFIDRDLAKKELCGKKVFPYEYINGKEYDYILISSLYLTPIIKEELIRLGVDEKKIICFASEEIALDLLNDVSDVYVKLNKLYELKALYKNQRCFIIGTGPSLATEDLERLKDEITFASNSIYALFEYTNWRPTYYCIDDPLMVNLFLEEDVKQKIIGNYKSIFVGISHWNKLSPILEELGSIYFFKSLSDVNMKKSCIKFSDNIVDGIYTSRTITYDLLQIAVYMEFKEIYLLGIDFTYSAEKSADGSIKYNDVVNHNSLIEKEDERTYLGAINKTGHKYLAEIDYQLWGYQSAKRYADAHGIEIYNATRGGKLEVFPRVDFDSLF